MKRGFTQKIAPYIEVELASAKRAKSAGDAQQEFSYLERAHVIGQESTYWHVKVHVLMLMWAIRNRSVQEMFGQVAATKTALGLVPSGNTGGADVSPFKKMPIDPELAALIQKAKSGV